MPHVLLAAIGQECVVVDQVLSGVTAAIATVVVFHPDGPHYSFVEIGSDEVRGGACASFDSNGGHTLVDFSKSRISISRTLLRDFNDPALSEWRPCHCQSQTGQNTIFVIAAEQDPMFDRLLAKLEATALTASGMCTHSMVLVGI